MSCYRTVSFKSQMPPLPRLMKNITYLGGSEACLFANDRSEVCEPFLGWGRDTRIALL